jgi:metacaspase-1
MLTAHRFTAVPSQDCRNRLEAALANERPIARGETHRGAVVAIQYALADLSRGYLLAAEVDGYFGPRTKAAVEAFQRDYGLIADGMVGRQTMSQLDTLYSGDVIRRPVGRSIHVGVDRLDANHYGGAFALASCVNDARKMQEIAESLGYSTSILENEQATVANFTGFMRGAISDLVAGDSLMITFSGHGSQLPNSSDDAETDMLDETLCFYDRMLVDDELYALLGQFREGIRVHAVFDSCHSATVTKDPFASRPTVPKDVLFEQEQVAYREQTEAGLKTLTTTTVTVVASIGGADEEEIVTSQTIDVASLSKALDGERPELADPPKPKKDVDDDLSGLFAELHAYRLTGDDKTIRLFHPIYVKNKGLYDAIKNVVGPQENQQLDCSVVTLSACQDSQTTPAGQVYSLFTYNLMSAWDSGAFSGSYRQFHRNLANVSPPESTPAINTYGTNVAQARLYERPLVL